ncbi:hypothetical protein PF008_g14006 [Phytophthora fragariae]|uniref:Uncharacterized protein n=1 Tax=Phytophthora fragariae TaxID=53985 RepID=A0A6G0RIE6_9STRA|nr:hypothetical protein PF008_g14006 [Phytophthora fragariae]
MASAALCRAAFTCSSSFSRTLASGDSEVSPLLNSVFCVINSSPWTGFTIVTVAC